MNTRREWLLIFGLCTAIGLLSASMFITANLLENVSEPISYTLINELTGAYSVFLLLPFMFAFMRHVPVRKNNLIVSIPAHLAGSVVFGISHTLLMTISRTFLYPLFGLGRYKMGDPFFRLLMEYSKQVLIYILILASWEAVAAYRRNREREKRTAELELQAAQLQARLGDAQLESLKGQLQPHFLFNTLNMISSEMYEDPRMADRMISRLSAMLRMSLERAARQKVPLAEELEFVSLYVDIMKARFGQKLEVRLPLNSNLAAALVPNFLLQPLVENAIKHNDLERSGMARVEVSIQQSENRLHISVADNGPGISADENAIAGKGLGLSNTRSRLKQLYGTNHLFEMKNRPEGGMNVQIILPLEFAGESMPEKTTA